MAIKLLIVDDDKHSTNLFSRLLSKYKFRIIIADTADLAAEYFELNHFDVILIDINLGLTQNDGLNLLLSIKSNKNTIQPLILASSSYATPNEEEQIMKLGFDGFFKKPINADFFVEYLKIKNIIQ